MEKREIKVLAAKGSLYTLLSARGPRHGSRFLIPVFLSFFLSPARESSKREDEKKKGSSVSLSRAYLTLLYFRIMESFLYGAAWKDEEKDRGWLQLLRREGDWTFACI